MGEPDQAENFFRQFTSCERRLWAFAVSLTRTHSDAEDVLQQANLQMWKNFSKFEPGTSFMSWAGRFVFNEARQHRRRKGRDRHEFGGDAFAKAVVEQSLNADVIAEQQSRSAVLGECVSALNADHQELLRAKYAEQMTVEQMGAMFDRSAAGIYQTLSRIRRRLHECVERKIRRFA